METMLGIFTGILTCLGIILAIQTILNGRWMKKAHKETLMLFK